MQGKIHHWNRRVRMEFEVEGVGGIAEMFFEFSVFPDPGTPFLPEGVQRHRAWIEQEGHERLFVAVNMNRDHECVEVGLYESAATHVTDDDLELASLIVEIYMSDDGWNKSREYAIGYFQTAIQEYEAITDKQGKKKWEQKNGRISYVRAFLKDLI